MKVLFPFLFLILNTLYLYSQTNGITHGTRFEQLGTILPDPNSYRSASGAPGPQYWQQKADYDIDVKLDESKQKIEGKETIVYTNNSPDPLTYLWLQLDENQHKKDGESQKFNESKMEEKMSLHQLQGIVGFPEDLGVKIVSVSDASGKKLSYTVNETMMRIDLPVVLKPGAKFQFKIEWWYNMCNRMVHGGRGGYEYFKEDDNYIFTVTQWYPRMAVYSDFQGWQHKQFTGRGEFALAFGDFKVKMTVPADHVVAATGECRNYSQMLTTEQVARWNKAQNAKEPVMIVTLDEAQKSEKAKSPATKTWIYEAKNVRDFAWTSSRKYCWDAMAVQIEGKKVMCMSYYPKDAYGLYQKFSTKAVAHTLRTYSKYTIPYPYPTAISVEAANGMEYPMICFNFGRTEKDGTYSEATRNGMLHVVFHEVGHNFFPMIINSDERQWSWMDEGLNTFVQFLTEQEWDKDYPSKRGPAYKIVDYMSLPKDQLEPIMTNSENIVQFGPNAYSKPATALNILRETVMGRELFDFAFKTYCMRWAFKHPTPSDFFRTMEDASAVDLDWFWRGWFYGIEPVDISLDKVTWFRMDTKDPAIENKLTKEKADKELHSLTRERNVMAQLPFEVESDTTLKDFYNHYNQYAVTGQSREAFKRYLESLTPEELMLYNSKPFFYELEFSNLGGCVMPVIIEWTFADGTKETEKISAYIWRKNEYKFTKVFAKEKEVASIQIDPLRETADINEDNNAWPRRIKASRFELFKEEQKIRGASVGGNPMQQGKSTGR